MIKQAIIPLGGLGTRLLPLTSVFAKELLPINGKPGIEYILDECIEAGIKEVIFIISQKKLMIKKYFYNDKFYKDIIKHKNDPRILNEYKKILKYKKMIKFVFQNFIVLLCNTRIFFTLNNILIKFVIIKIFFNH